MEKIFADGLFFKERNPKAPSFIKGQISVSVDKFVDFLSKVEHDRGWVNFDMKESKGGKIYFELNMYKATQSKVETITQQEIPVIQEPIKFPPSDDEIDISNIPF